VFASGQTSQAYAKNTVIITFLECLTRRW